METFGEPTIFEYVFLLELVDPSNAGSRLKTRSYEDSRDWEEVRKYQSLEVEKRELYRT